MNPQIAQDVAAGHSRDLRKQAAASRRARAVRRARRSAVTSHS
jgi:hypothetical protein